MPRKPKGRLRSVRGQKINKVVEKEQLMRVASLKYVRNNVVANEDGHRVSRASRPTKQSLIKDNNSKCKDTFTTNGNLDALSKGLEKSNPSRVLVSKEMKKSATSKLNGHLLSSSKNTKDTVCGGGISLEKETPISTGSKDDWISTFGNSTVQVTLMRRQFIAQSTSVHNQSMSRLQTTGAHMQIDQSLMNDVSGDVNDLDSQPTNLYPSEDSNVQGSPFEKSTEGSRRPKFTTRETLVHKENNFNGVIEYNACPSSVNEGSTSMQAMEVPIHTTEDFDRLSKYDSVVPPRSKGKPSSRQGKGTDGGISWLDVQSFKAMRSEQRYIEIDEGEGGDVHDKNPTDLNVEINNPTCVKDDTKVIVQLENLTCGAIKEQRENKQDIEPDYGDQNPEDVEDGNGGDIIIEFPIKINNQDANDRGVQSLIGFDGKTHGIMSKGTKESMQENTNVTVACDDDDDSEEDVWLTRRPKKKRRQYIVTCEDEEVEQDGVDHDCISGESKAREVSKVGVVLSMDCIAKVPMPSVPVCVKKQCYCCSKPIDEPVWRGTLKVGGREYTSLVGHLSTKSCEKVWKLSKSLQTSVEVMKLSGSKVRSKIWDSSKPSDDNIGLYLFPHEMRHDANLDQLINEVMENDLVLQAVIGEVEMLIFPSCLLPKRYKTFQSKHYLWALFKQREVKFAAAAKPLNGTVSCAQEEGKGKGYVSDLQDDVDNVEPNQEIISMKSIMPLESQGLVNSHLCMEKQLLEGSGSGGMDRSVNCKSPAESAQQVSASCVPGATDIGFQINVPDERKQENARRHSVHVAEATAVAATSVVVPEEVTAHATNAANIPTNHEQFNASMGVPLRKIYFVARQTPRVEQILQELDREGSLLFAKRGEAIGAGHGPGSIVATMQQ